MFYRLVRRLFLVVAAPLFRFRVEGAADLSSRGPGVLVATHRSWLDPLCLGAACARPIHFLILRDVYDKRWATWFYRRMEAIPVSPGGRGSLAGLRRALRKLRSGKLIGVFPEGRVFAAGTATTVHAGAALLAVHAGAPVIPVEIHGSAEAWPHGRLWPGPASVRVRIRSPLMPPPARNRAAVRELQRRIEAVMHELDAVTDPRGGRADEPSRAHRSRQ